MGKWP